jgi:hypothetical protein
VVHAEWPRAIWTNERSAKLHGSPVKPGDDVLFRCRGAPSHPSFAHATKSQAKKPSPKISSLKKGGGAPKGADRAASKSDAARTLSPALSFSEKTEVAGTSWSGRARLSAPHRGTRRGFIPGSARAALPGTTGCKREDPLRHQCSEHLAVRHAPDGTMPKPPASAVYRCAHENRSRSASRSTLAKGVLRERDGGYVTAVGTKVKSDVALLGTRCKGAISAASSAIRLPRGGGLRLPLFRPALAVLCQTQTIEFFKARTPF